MVESPQRMHTCSVSPSIMPYSSCNSWARVVSCQKQTLQMGQGRFLSKTDIADGPGSFLVKNRHCRWARVVSCQKQTLQMGQGCFLSKTDIADGSELFLVKNRHCRCLLHCPSAPIAILPVWLCLAREVLLRSLPAHGLQCKLQDV